MATDTGGPAFPAKTRDGKEFGDDFTTGGMTLRDWFAAQALLGLLTSVSPVTISGAGVALSETAYVLADAMIVQRGK